MASWACEGVGAVSEVNELSKTGPNFISLLRSPEGSELGLPLSAGLHIDRFRHPFP